MSGGNRLLRPSLKEGNRGLFVWRYLRRSGEPGADGLWDDFAVNLVIAGRCVSLCRDLLTANLREMTIEGVELALA